jgi:hypothetical protein
MMTQTLGAVAASAAAHAPMMTQRLEVGVALAAALAVARVFMIAQSTQVKAVLVGSRKQRAGQGQIAIGTTHARTKIVINPRITNVAWRAAAVLVVKRRLTAGPGQMPLAMTCAMMTYVMTWGMKRILKSQSTTSVM